MLDLKIHDALGNIFSLIRAINKYLETKQPWHLIKVDKKDSSPAATCLYVSAEMLRISAQLLLPFIPNKANITLRSLSVSVTESSNTIEPFGYLKPQTLIKPPGSLFPRIDE